MYKWKEERGRKAQVEEKDKTRDEHARAYTRRKGVK